MSMKDLISKMDQIQGVQTTGLPSTSTTQSGPQLLNERTQNIEEIGGLVRGAVNLGGKALGGIASGLGRVGNAVVQGTKAAAGGLSNKTPQQVAAAAKANAAKAAEKAKSLKTADLQAKAAAATKAGDPNAGKLAAQAAKAAKAAPAPTALQKAGDVAAKVGKTALGATALGGLAYGGKKAYDYFTKDDNKPEPSPEPAPGPKPPPKPPVVGPKPSPTPADDTDPRIDPYKPDTPVIPSTPDDMPNMQKPVDNDALAPYEKQNTAAPASAGGYAQSATAADNDDLAKGSSSYTGPIGNADNDPLAKPAATSAVPKDNRRFYGAFADINKDYSTGRPVDKELDDKYGTGNTRTDDAGRTYVRQKGVMGGPDSEQRSYASFGDFFNKIRGKGDVNGRMDEEVEQLLDAIIEAQEIDRITSLSGITEAKLPPGYYDPDPTIPRRAWDVDNNFKMPMSPYIDNAKMRRDASAGYGRYGKNTADMQKFINQLGYKDKQGRPLSVDARYGPQTTNALHALKNKLDPNSAEYKTLRSFDAAAVIGDKDSRIQGPVKKPTPAKPTTTSDIPAPSNTTEPKPSPMNADSLRAKIDAAAGKDTLSKSDDSGQPVLKTADEWQKDKDSRQAALSFAGKAADTNPTPGSTSALPKSDDSSNSLKPSKSFSQMGMVGQDFEESIMREANEIARIANLSGLVLSEAKMKDLVSKKVKGTYGTEYQGDEDEDDTNDKKAKAKDSEKKKRGGQFKGDKDTSGKEKFGGADDAMKAMGVGKAKKSKELDKLPAKKHSLKEYFDETEALVLAEAQHAGIMDEVADAMFQLETALFESAGLLDESQCFEHICECYPHEVKLFIDRGDLDPDLFHELTDHYKRHARVPHRIARERDVTTLFDLIKGLFEGDLGMNVEVQQAEEPMEVDEGIEDALQNILPKSMQPFNTDTAAAFAKSQAPVKKVKEATKPW